MDTQETTALIPPSPSILPFCEDYPPSQVIVAAAAGLIEQLPPPRKGRMQLVTEITCERFAVYDLRLKDYFFGPSPKTELFKLHHRIVRSGLVSFKLVSESPPVFVYYQR